MPLFYEKNISGEARLAIWHITEPETFFLDSVRDMYNISHPQKRLQHLAGRYLLRHLDPTFPIDQLQVSTNGKPYLPQEEYHFSISHCREYAAAILSKTQPAGIDLEIMSPKLDRLSHKFMNEHEGKFLSSPLLERLEWLTLLWSCKEAMFKWYGKGQVDFKRNLLVEDIEGTAQEGHLAATFQKEIKSSLTLQYRFFGHLCLVWVIGDEA